MVSNQKMLFFSLLSGVLLTGCALEAGQTPTEKMTEVSEKWTGEKRLEESQIEELQAAEQEERSAEKTAQKEWNYEFHYGSDYWSYFDLANSFVPAQGDYEKLVAQYIPQIEQLLGAEDWYMAYNPEADTILVNMEMGATPISYTYPTSNGADHTIEFSQLLSLKQIGSPIDRVLSHELTHSVLGNGKCFSNSLEEGICEYVCARVGNCYSDFFQTYSIDIMDMFYCGTSAVLEQRYDEDAKNKMLDASGRSGGYTYSLQTDDAIVWYGCSQCFVEYLVKNYGMEKTMQLIREGKSEDDYQACLGVSFDALKQVWIDDFMQYEPEYTQEEYLQMSRRFYATLEPF